MRPLALKGHERPLTKVRMNREGDLLFTASKDKSSNICVWYTENGERLGTFDGHNGVVWDVDATWDSRSLVSGSGDNSCALWDCETGRQLHRMSSPSGVRRVGFSYSGQLFFFATMQQMKAMSSLNVFDMRAPEQMVENQPAHCIPTQQSALSALWSHLDDTIITGHENGAVNQYDLRGKSVEPANFVSEPHRYSVMDLQLSADQTMLISASKDKTARLFDAHTLDHLKTYKAERAVNSAAVSPIRDHIVLGGGEEAMTVTQTAADVGHFEAKFYHLIFEEEFARVKGHFGPINTIAFHPDGRSFVSGGEDGYVRVQTFDDDYFDFEYETG